MRNSNLPLDDLYIRWLNHSDMPTVIAIENFSFAYPWDVSDFQRELRQRNVIGMAATFGGRLAGYMVYEMLANRIELNNLAVTPEFRRMGVGRAMIAKLRSKMHPERRRRMTTVVRETNVEGQKFFRGCGFVCTNVLKDQYDETHEDGYLFSLYSMDASETLNSQLTGAVQ